jgi:hypothetical protein
MARKRTDHGRGTALAAGPGPSGVWIKGRLWLEKDRETFLSWGRVVLLEHIRDQGSIAAAARPLQRLNHASGHRPGPGHRARGFFS